MIISSRNTTVKIIVSSCAVLKPLFLLTLFKHTQSLRHLANANALNSALPADTVPYIKNIMPYNYKIYRLFAVTIISHTSKLFMTNIVY